MRALALAILAWLAAVPARAEVLASPASDVSVTIYRAPGRGQGAMDRNWPGGYALISETRTVTIPAGDSIVRFEGVADGLLPETAIVTGLPRGVREKNRDARLISPAGLVDAYLKRRVRLTRTNLATGKMRAQEAVVQAGPDGGVVLTTSEGVEALRCSGLPERMIYDRVPAGLSARPTLSVLTSSDRAVTATVQLTYMAQGFDWSASYVAQARETPGKFALFAWATLANGGAESFRDARVQVIAGQPRKVANAPPLAQRDATLRLKCWPMDITSTHPRYEFNRLPWPLTPPQEELAMDAGENIVVTGSVRRRGRYAAAVAPPPPALEMASPVMVAVQEELGDLKLYRIPERVTVAAQAQKQVAMLDRPEATLERFYVANASAGGPEWAAMPFLLRGRNARDKGLGEPLPAGALALFESVDGRLLLAGETSLADIAVDERIELPLGQSPDVRWRLIPVKRTRDRQDWRAELTNARDTPVRAEILIPYDLAERPAGIERGRGGWVLPVEVPDHGTASVAYAIKLRR